jgi:hypothetical protein
VLRQVDLAVVDHDGLRRHRRQQRLAILIGEPADIDNHVGWQAVVWRPDISLPGGGLGQRPDRLEQHRRRVHRLGRHGSEPQPGDAPVIQIHRGRELALHPAQRQRVHREHVQPRGVQQKILTRPRRPQPPVGGGRAPGDLPLGLRPAERGRALADLPQQRPGPRRLQDRHRPLTVLCPQPRGDLVQDQVLGGLARLGMLAKHPLGHLHPARIRPGQRRPPAPPPIIGQPCRATGLEVLQPAAKRGHAHADLGSLGSVPGQQGNAGRVLRPRLAVCRQLRAPAAEPGPHFLDVRDPCPQLR